MRRIDIFGPSGVGKSTLLNSLVKNKKKRIWLTSIEAKNKILYNNFKKPKKNLIDYVKNTIYGLQNNRFTPSFDKEKLKKFFSKKAYKYNEIIDIALKTIGDDKNIPSFMKAKRISWLVSTLEDIVLLEEYYNDEIILFDESLLNRSLHLIVNTSSEDLSFIKKFNLPYKFIYIKLDINNIFKRLKSRRRITFDHARMNDEQLFQKIEKDVQYSEFVCLKLKDYGIEGLVIDGLMPINKNLDKINSYLFNSS